MTPEAFAVEAAGFYGESGISSPLAPWTQAELDAATPEQLVAPLAECVASLGLNAREIGLVGRWAEVEADDWENPSAIFVCGHATVDGDPVSLSGRVWDIDDVFPEHDHRRLLSGGLSTVALEFAELMRPEFRRIDGLLEDLGAEPTQAETDERAWLLRALADDLADTLRSGEWSSFDAVCHDAWSGQSLDTLRRRVRDADLTRCCAVEGTSPWRRCLRREHTDDRHAYEENHA